MKIEEKQATDILRQLANEKFPLPDLSVSLSYTGESMGEKEKESEQFNRRILQEVEKRRGAIY